MNDNGPTLLWLLFLLWLALSLNSGAQPKSDSVTDLKSEQVTQKR